MFDRSLSKHLFLSNFNILKYAPRTLDLLNYKKVYNNIPYLLDYDLDLAHILSFNSLNKLFTEENLFPIKDYAERKYS